MSNGYMNIKVNPPVNAPLKALQNKNLIIYLDTLMVKSLHYTIY